MQAVNPTDTRGRPVSGVSIRPLPVAWLVLLCLVGLALLACGSDGPTPVPWSPLPLDGKCRSGMVLQPSESCVHEFSYVAEINSSGTAVYVVVERASNRFAVDSEGVAHYGKVLSGTTLRSSVDLGNEVVTFAAGIQSDDTFYIQEATQLSQLDLTQVIGGVLACELGAELRPGEGCALSGTSTFSSEPSGQGCFNGSICAGSRLTVQDFVAVRDDDGSWRIASLP